MSQQRSQQNRFAFRWGWLWLIPALVVLFAFALRVLNLSAQSIWFDEGWSWYLARLPIGEMAKITSADRSPVLYYALLHMWTDLVGESPFVMRYLSVIADTTTVALVIVLAQALFKRARHFPVSGVLYAVCPFAVWYAQETRMYALVGALCAASSYWLWRWLREPDRRVSLLASAVLMAAAINTHYYAVFLLPSHGLAVVLFTVLQSSQQARGKRLRLFVRNAGSWVVAMMGVAVVLVPWLLFASSGFAYDDGFVFPLNTVDGRLGEWINAFASGGIPRPQPDFWPMALICAAAITCVLCVIRRRWRALAFLLIMTVGSLLAASIAVRIVYPYRSVFHPRYLIYVIPCTVVMLGGVGQVMLGDSRRARPSIIRLFSAIVGLLPMVLLTVLWLPALMAIYRDPTVARDNTRAAMVHVVEALKPGDVVIVTRDNYAVQYYLHTQFAAYANQFIAFPAGLHGVLKTDVDYVAALRQYNPDRVRLFLWQDQVVDPHRLIESTLWANGYELGEISFGQIRLPLFQMVKHPITAVPVQSADVQFADALNLAGFWMRAEGYPGDWFYAVLRWSVIRKINANYKVFIHVLAPDGHTVFQRDKLPLSDLLPMTTWKVGETVSDAYAMVIPANLPVGDYRIYLGIYDPYAQAMRLHTQSSMLLTADDSVMLGTLHIHKR